MSKLKITVIAGMSILCSFRSGWSEEIIPDSVTKVPLTEVHQTPTDSSSEVAVNKTAEPAVNDSSSTQNAERQKERASNSNKDSDTVQSLDKMVVSATRSQRRISETPASVSIISREEIEVSPAKDLNDLIANKTGVQVRRVVGMGEGVPSDIILRGIPGALAAARTLILVDGIPTNASGTPFLILSEIPVEIIENVEIVRGPYSSLYGANAFGGVINVVTKKGDGRPGGGLTFETSYPFSVAQSWADDHPIRKAAKLGAERGLWSGDVLSSGGNEKVHYLVNAGYRTIGNYLIADSALVAKTDTQYFIPTKLDGEEMYSYNDWRLFGKMGIRLNERWSIALHTRYFKSDLGYGYTRYSQDTVPIVVKGEKVIVGPEINFHVNDKVDLKAVGYVRRLLGLYVAEMDRQPVSWESNTHDWQIDLQGVIRPFADHIFTTGMEFLSNKVEFGDLTNKTNKTVIEKGHSDRITNAGAYIQDEWTIGGRFHAVPGIRVDYHTVFGAAVSPKIGLSFNCTDKVRLRGSFGRAFRAPNHTELFMPPLPLKDTITLTSNPDLKPEYILATDGGVDVTPIRNLKLQWGLFYNNMKDLIGQGVRIDDIGKQYVTHDNISSAWSMGSELEAEWAIVKGVKVHGNYVLQKSRNVSATEIAKERSEVNPDADLPTDIRLDYIPSHKGGIGFVFSRKIGRIKLSFSADQLFVGSRTYQKFDELELTPEQVRIGFNEDGSIHVDANPKVVTLPWYNRTDLQMRYDLLYFWMTVSVQNLFNIHYEESFGTYVPGRLATVKIGAAW